MPLFAAIVASAQAYAGEALISPNNPRFERAVNCMAIVSEAEQGLNELGFKIASLTIEFRAKRLAAKGERDAVCVAAWSRHGGGYADYSATQSQRALMEIYAHTKSYTDRLERAKRIARMVLTHRDDAQLAWLRRKLDDSCLFFENVDLRKETPATPRVVRWVIGNSLTDTPHFQLTPQNLIIVGCLRQPQ